MREIERVPFEDLPKRIFLDSGTLQTLRDYSEAIYENVLVPEVDRAHSIPGLLDEVEALRKIFSVAQRTPFQFAISGNSLEEVLAKKDADYERWAGDVLDRWLVDRIETGIPAEGEARAAVLDGPEFGYLSAKDRLLLRDAIALGCDAFLTVDRKLAKNAEHIYVATGLRVLLPTQLWAMLQPYAALFA